MSRIKQLRSNIQITHLVDLLFEVERFLESIERRHVEGHFRSLDILQDDLTTSSVHVLHELHCMLALLVGGLFEVLVYSWQRHIVSIKMERLQLRRRTENFRNFSEIDITIAK